MSLILTELTLDVSRANPGASNEEICLALIDEIETITSDIMRELELPPPHSPVQMKLEELFLRRLGLRRRRVTGYDPFSQRDFIQDLYYLQKELDGHERGSASLVPQVIHRETTDVPPPIPRLEDRNTDRDIWRGAKALITERPGLLELEKKLRFQTNLPSESDIDELEEPPERIILDAEAQKRVMVDSLFADVFRVIETRIRRIGQGDLENASFILSLEKDLEIPTWEKLVVKVDIPQMGFSQKMDLWDKIGSEVRNSVDELKEYPQPPTEKELANIRKRLFVRMSLG